MAAATKDDLTFDKSTKRITVPAAFDEVTVQVLVDAVRQQEDEIDYLDIPQIISAVGKDPLGGGEFTVITATLEDDWQLVFAGAAGTVYRVTAGNLIATDSNGDPSEPIYTEPTTKTVVLANATTGSINETSVQNQIDYVDGVYLDPDNGIPGTTHPAGTLAQPVDTFTDALTIAQANNSRIINILPTASIQNLDADVHGMVIRSLTRTAHINLTAGNVVTDARFEGCHLTGAANATRHWFADDSILAAGAILSGSEGTFTNCLIQDEMILQGDATFFNCASGVAGFGTCTVDAAGSASLQFRSFVGGITIQNLTAGDGVSLDVMPGRIVLDASCTGGNVKIRGIGEPLVDNSTGTTLDTDGFLVADDVAIARKLLQNRTETSQATGQMTVYDDDGSVLYTGNIWQDVDGTVPYAGQGIERRERLT